MAKNPVLVIVGLDPGKHILTPMLAHHVSKLKKDFVLAFLSEEDISEKTGEALKSLLKSSGFVPEERKRIITNG